jgi:SNF family Na+-dependent transporter
VWEYIFSIVGLTVGFGSFWRFPYLIYKNGGGVFLVPYFVSIIVVGVPLLYLETAVGQMHRVSIPFILKRIHPSLKMLGIMFLLNSLQLSSVYNLLLTYSYRFIFTAFKFDLPFAHEDITDNTYFRETILEQSKSINDFEGINPFLFVLYAASLLICHFIVKNGVKSSGKIITITAISPFVLIFILLIRSLFLNGTQQALTYLFSPKWEKIWEGQIWVDAMIQVFYQFGLGVGTLFCVSCLNPRRQNLLKGVIYVPLGLLLCGFLSALTIFFYLSHFCLEIGMDINNPSIHLAGP